MSMIARLSFVAASLVAAAASGGGVWEYELSARAVATGVPDVMDSTTTEPTVFAMNIGGSTDPDSPSTVESTAEGGPRSGAARVFAEAESFGPLARGVGTARIDAVDDQIFFTASEPFRVRVSADIGFSLSTNWVGDVAQVTLVSGWAVRDTMGVDGQSQSFRSNIRDNGGNVTVINDDTDPLEFDLEPGESVVLSVAIRATADAAGVFEQSAGDASAEIETTFYVEVIEGDAAIASSISGAEYGPPPACNRADLDAPFGLLDLADIVAFVTLFGANDPAVDFDGNMLFDLADVVAFVNAFTAGCP